LRGGEWLSGPLPAEDALNRLRSGQRLLAEAGSRLVVAREGGAIVGAALAQVLPGATGVLWPPCAAPGVNDSRRVEDALLNEALAWLRRGGARLAQAVLARGGAHLAATRPRGGLTPPTQAPYPHGKPRPPPRL